MLFGLTLLLESDLDVQQTHASCQVLEQKLILKLLLQAVNHNKHCYIFGHTLLCFLSLTWLFNKQRIVV